MCGYITTYYWCDDELYYTNSVLNILSLLRWKHLCDKKKSWNILKVQTLIFYTRYRKIIQCDIEIFLSQFPSPLRKEV